MKFKTLIIALVLSMLAVVCVQAQDSLYVLTETQFIDLIKDTFDKGEAFGIKSIKEDKLRTGVWFLAAKKSEGYQVISIESAIYIANHPDCSAYSNDSGVRLLHGVKCETEESLKLFNRNYLKPYKL